MRKDRLLAKGAFILLHTFILLGASVTSLATKPGTIRENPTNKHDSELFSVAPMMAHTNRHYRQFFRSLSSRAVLYTEMIPAGKIIQSFYSAVSGDEPRPAMDSDEIVEHVLRMKEKYTCHCVQPLLDFTSEELFSLVDDNVILQLGGRDPEQLALAAAIGSACGFRGINLNCGCPSTSVSGRATGAALMKEPGTVARCLECMSYQMEEISPETILSVKHRLGVKNADDYDAEQDHAKDDTKDYKTCYDFVNTISLSSKVSQIQIHARVALLDLNGSDLWVPTKRPTGSSTKTKIDHARVQYMAKKMSRQSTLRNRSVPPLRPLVVERIAEAFPSLLVSSNGGITSIAEVQRRLSTANVAGTMVGRAVINHPCSFAGVDSILWGESSAPTTRLEVITQYMEYCRNEENRFASTDRNDLIKHRKRLVAPMYHLFMGEEGNEAFQRRLRKLVSRADRHSTHSMLSAAVAEVPSAVLQKPATEHVPWSDIPKYDFNKRSGAMQRTIY